MPHYCITLLVLRPASALRSQHSHPRWTSLTSLVNSSSAYSLFSSAKSALSLLLATASLAVCIREFMYYGPITHLLTQNFLRTRYKNKFFGVNLSLPTQKKSAISVNQPAVISLLPLITHVLRNSLSNMAARSLDTKYSANHTILNS